MPGRHRFGGRGRRAVVRMPGDPARFEDDHQVGVVQSGLDQILEVLGRNALQAAVRKVKEFS
jgi:hypothetical protein